MRCVDVNVRLQITSFIANHDADIPLIGQEISNCVWLKICVQMHFYFGNRLESFKAITESL